MLLNPEDIYRTLAQILLDETNLKFASLMVEQLNMILLTSSELYELRTELKDLKTKVFFLILVCVLERFIAVFFLFFLGKLRVFFLSLRDLVSQSCRDDCFVSFVAMLQSRMQPDQTFVSFFFFCTKQNNSSFVLIVYFFVTRHILADDAERQNAHHTEQHIRKETNVISFKNYSLIITQQRFGGDC